MLNEIKNIDWKKCYCLISFSLIVFFIEFTIYRFFYKFSIQKYWVIMPVFLYLVLRNVYKHIHKFHNVTIFIEISSLIALILFYSSIRIRSIYILLENKYEFLSFIICLIFFGYLIVEYAFEKQKDIQKKESLPNQLFNLFYLNTSKAHEIAMLIDNKIMKTIEKEQVSEELLKHNASISASKNNSLSAKMGYSVEDSSMKRVYENFDVKTTKSIMLRKIYETALKNEKMKLNIGDLAVFNNIELQQKNIDDTIMILNVLQDSKIKNRENEDLEININKMIEKMLDDFTVDYIFDYKQDEGENKQYLIQLPYKSADNFENGYKYNDLQLGKLSLIGIYRGEIDFSKKESISSKFLEIISESYNNTVNNLDGTGEMRLSHNQEDTDGIKFDFKHQKLKEKFYLIDVIAIIQELNFNKEG